MGDLKDKYGREVVGKVGEDGRMDTSLQVQKYLQKEKVIAWTQRHPREAWALREMQKDQRRCHQQTGLYCQIVVQGDLDQNFMEYLWRLATAYESGRGDKEII